MGTLFDDDDEHPDYQPMPTAKQVVKEKVVYTVVIAGVVFAVHDLCPKSKPVADPPQREFVQLPSAFSAAAVSSTSGNVTLPAGHLGLTGLAPTVKVS
jgi:hypothetical protein